jgi:hypothetical protein
MPASESAITNAVGVTQSFTAGHIWDGEIAFDNDRAL